jgi:TolB protein
LFTLLKQLVISAKQLLVIVRTKEEINMNNNWNMNKIGMLALVPALALTLSACGGNGGTQGQVVVKEPNKTITVIKPSDKDIPTPGVSVEKVTKYDGLELFDWLDDRTIIVSKTNETLPSMALADYDKAYPRSLYRLNLETGKYDLVKEQKDVFLGGASLSADKKHLLYTDYALGDPGFHVLNLETGKSFQITGKNIAGAKSGGWADATTVIGAAYIGGAYTADVNGTIAPLPELKESSLVIVRQVGDQLYYNTGDDPSLVKLDLATKQKTPLGISGIGGLTISPDGKQLAIQQYDSTGTGMTLLVTDADGKNPVTVAAGAEIGGVSWSPDQRMIAYTVKSGGNDGAGNGLYVYDLLTGKSTALAVDITQASTVWSPSSNALAVTEYKDNVYNARVLQLAVSMQ